MIVISVALWYRVLTGREDCVYVEPESVCDISVLSALFCCEPKIALKNVFLKKLEGCQSCSLCFISAAKPRNHNFSIVSMMVTVEILMERFILFV